MQLGFVGLGKMGGNMVHRIHRDSDHTVVAFDFSEEAVQTAASHGATGASSLEELVDRLLRRIAGRHHQPDHPRLLELADEVLERGGAARTMRLGRLHGLVVEVEGDDLMVRVAMDAMDHVAAHLPEADEAELHQESSFSRSSRVVRTASRPWARSVCRSPSACARMSVASE